MVPTAFLSFGIVVILFHLSFFVYFLFQFSLEYCFQSLWSQSVCVSEPACKPTSAVFLSQIKISIPFHPIPSNSIPFHPTIPFPSTKRERQLIRNLHSVLPENFQTIHYTIRHGVMSVLTHHELWEEDDRGVCHCDGRTLAHTGLPLQRDPSDRRTVDLSSAPVEMKTIICSLQDRRGR